ncbi:MAG TPA: LLM class flavin-dependent oxidoreductase [Candidatus Cybelea sp.]|nr:LLM class flavin-dependent oxidoreductase [Candidatus Cybelea sp.]
MTAIPLRHGIFLAPFHPVDEDPTQAIHRDLDLVQWLDRLGYHEAWIGEHHSAGFEIIASPELFIAAAAERTKRIRLGTGVISLPYHNPLMAANRMIQLDHMTMGRAMFGVGPGLLTSDAMMLGIDPNTQRDRMVEALDLILRLMTGETITEKTDWYTLVNARVHLMPYTKPRPEVCVASSVTPHGGRVAGKYGVGMLCVAATNPFGFDALSVNWQIAKETAAEHGRKMDPSALRLVGPMHIAETREQARANVKFGLAKFADYFARINPLVPRDTSGKDLIDIMVDDRGSVIGTPDDAIAKIEQLYGKQGEFGAFLQLAHNWADWEATKKHYELFARYVMPHFAKANANRKGSFDFVTEHGQEYGGRQREAAMKMFAKHEAEQKAKAAGKAAE